MDVSYKKAYPLEQVIQFVGNGPVQVSQLFKKKKFKFKYNFNKIYEISHVTQAY